MSIKAENGTIPILQDTTGSDMRIIMLVEYIQSGGPLAFDIFMNCLREMGKGYLSEKILASLTSSPTQQYPGGDVQEQIIRQFSSDKMTDEEAREYVNNILDNFIDMDHFLGVFSKSITLLTQLLVGSAVADFPLKDEDHAESHYALLKHPNSIKLTLWQLGNESKLTFGVAQENMHKISLELENIRGHFRKAREIAVHEGTKAAQEIITYIEKLDTILKEGEKLKLQKTKLDEDNQAYKSQKEKITEEKRSCETKLRELENEKRDLSAISVQINKDRVTCQAAILQELEKKKKKESDDNNEIDRDITDGKANVTVSDGMSTGQMQPPLLGDSAVEQLQLFHWNEFREKGNEIATCNSELSEEIKNIEARWNKLKADLEKRDSNETTEKKKSIDADNQLTELEKFKGHLEQREREYEENRNLIEGQGVELELERKNIIEGIHNLHLQSITYAEFFYNLKTGKEFIPGSFEKSDGTDNYLNEKLSYMYDQEVDVRFGYQHRLKADLFDVQEKIRAEEQELIKLNNEVNELNFELEQLNMLGPVKNVTDELRRTAKTLCDITAEWDGIARFFTNLFQFIDIKLKDNVVNNEGMAQYGPSDLDQLMRFLFETMSRVVAVETMAKAYERISSKYFMPQLANLGRFMMLADNNELECKDLQERITEVGKTAENEISIILHDQRSEYVEVFVKRYEVVIRAIRREQ
uniref:Uncharacterized protein n=1 Tax=Plectus sambesii TaxID=2011161 RepID=A0A914XQF7_9BILA